MTTASPLDSKQDVQQNVLCCLGIAANFQSWKQCSVPLFLKYPSSSQIFPWGYLTLLLSTHHLPLVCICKCTRLQCTQLLQLEPGVVSFMKIAGVFSPSFLLFLLSCFITNHCKCSSLKTQEFLSSVGQKPRHSSLLRVSQLKSSCWWLWSHLMLWVLLAHWLW